MFVYCPISRHEDPHNVQVPFCSGPGITSSRSLLSNVLFLAIFCCCCSHYKEKIVTLLLSTMPWLFRACWY